MTDKQTVRVLRRKLDEYGRTYAYSMHYGGLISAEFNSDGYIVDRLRARLQATMHQLGVTSLDAERVFPAARSAWLHEVQHEPFNVTPPTYDAWSFGDYLLCGAR